MRILFTLTRAFNPNDAGVQRTTYKLGKYFSEQGFEVVYFSTKVNGHVPVQFGKLSAVSEEGGMDNPANVLCLEKTVADFLPHIVINQMPYEQKLRRGLFELKSKYHFYLIGCLRNSLFNFFNTIPIKAKQLLPLWLMPLFYFTGAHFIIRWLHTLKHAETLRNILDEHDHFVLLAPQNIEELSYFVRDYKKDKVTVIPNSIPEVFPQYLQTKKPIILYVGSLNIQQKRSDLLIPFWLKIHERLIDWEFVIVGHGDYADKIKTEISNKKIPRIRLEGFKKPESYYAEASMFIMPSAYEGFPNTILEAQSYGCPVLAFASYAAINSIVNDKHNALLTAPYNIQEMADNAVGLATHKQELENMQLASVDNARRFTIDRVGAQWLTFFDSVIK